MCLVYILVSNLYRYTICVVDVAECPTLTPKDDDCSITVVFIVLFVISVVINFITIAVIIYLVVRLRKSSYSPNM